MESSQQADWGAGLAPNRRALQVACIVVVAFLVYANSIGDKYVWDDNDFIVKWEKTRSLDNIPELLKGAVPPGHEGVFRPLRGVIYALSYQLWGLNSVGYRIQAIFVHIACTLLVYFIAAELMKSRDIAFLSGLLFAVHPVHTEAITFTTTTFDLMGTVFALASFLLYLRWRRGGDPAEFASSVVLAAAAFLTDELMLVLPLLVLLYELCMRGRGDWKPAASGPYFILVGSFVLFRFFVLHLIARKDFIGGSIYYTTLAMTKAFREYVVVTVFPVYLSVDHTLSPGIRAFTHERGPAVAQSIFDVDILLSIALIVALLAAAAFFFRRKPVVSFSIGWFIAGLLPVSNAIPQAALMRERYLYLPSFGFCLLAAVVVYELWGSAMRHNMRAHAFVVAALFMLVVAGMSYRTIARNMDWKDSLTLWESAVRDNPDSSYSLYNLGVEYGEQGRSDDAIAVYDKAIAANPQDKWSYLNKGVRYEDLGRYDDSIAQYKLAIGIDPNFSQAHYDLGVRYQQTGMVDDAVAEYKTAAETDPSFSFPHYNLGNVYLNRGKPEQAIMEYMIAIDLKKNYPEALNNLGIAYYDVGRYDDAVEAYKRAIVQEPGYEQAYSNLGNAYMSEGMVGDAIEQYKKSLDVNPLSAGVHKSLGDAYKSQGRELDAQNEYQAALKIDQRFGSGKN